MDELTMLVHLAGGEPDVARRLHAAGFRKAKDLARAAPEDLRAKIGLSAGVSRRLVRVASETVLPVDSRKLRAARSGLTAVPSIATGPERRGAPATTVGRSVPPAAVEPTEHPPAGAEGVSNEETSALTGAPPREERTAPSFWRFG